MIISVHIPKTAGTSFKHLLQQQFHERLLLDYTERPIWNNRVKGVGRALFAGLRMMVRHENKGEYQCVHGHFLALKYRFLQIRRNASYVVWLREPAERLISHYYYWKRTPPAPGTPPLRAHVHALDYSLEDFCQEPLFRNLYSKFLFGVNLDQFDFIGITEDFDRSIDLFRKIFSFGLEENSNKNRNPDRQ